MKNYLRGAPAQRLLRFAAYDQETGCLNFKGGKTKDGYGRMYYKGGRALAHRVSYAEWVAQIPDGMQVLHKCDNPSCIKPSHLFLGTVQDNMDDMKRKGRGRSVRGSAHHKAKLQPHEAYAIRWQALAGLPHKQIAKSYNVSRQLVTEIARFKAWQFEAHD